MKKDKNFYDLEVLKQHIAEEKDVNYLKLLDYSSPRNHDYSHNRKAEPVFQYLLKNIPDLWQKVDCPKYDSYINNSDKKDSQVILAEKVIGIVQHYANDNYWKDFVSKIGQDIKKYNKEDKIAMWTIAILDYTPGIFSEMDLSNEVEKSIGRKALNTIYLNNIEQLRGNYWHEVDSALRDCSQEELLILVKHYVQKDKFQSIELVQKNSESKGQVVLSNEQILNIKIGTQSFESYLQDKKQSYTLDITGQPIEKGSHTLIDTLFHRHLIKNEDKRDQMRNYLYLVDIMKKLDIPNVEDQFNVEVKEPKTNKKKLK